MSAEDPLSALKVNYSHLDEIAEQIRLRKQMVIDQMEALWREVQKTEDVWEGEAKQMFRAVDKQWHARASDIKEQLGRIENLVRDGSGKYHATDLKASRLFEQIGGW
ncbi:WXG100 family type VII secretion target [Streptomyces sp. PU-14G]|uniref:WXG100 family type VII secretion target n=1 Tax=Streptomyces sp. PU-14G TaxID=2800808 RepID=UPI0034DF5942